MSKYLAKLDWNNMLMNKTTGECWNILKYEIESIIDKCVPLKKKKGKRSRKKCLDIVDMNVSEQCGIAASKGNRILGLIRRNITYKENS